MKILVFNGSPKKEKSDTMHITRAFLDGMREAAAQEIRTIDVTDKHIEFCRGCFVCKYNGGHCAIDDDMREILEQMLGSGFIRTDRATLVAAKGIHAIGRQIELINGETLDYAHRRKQQLKEQLRADWRQIAQSLSNSDAPATREDYQRHYASYDSAPFAFTDIEMVFNEKRAAVDWIFRYANEALARLEKKPLEQLIDRSFSSIFPNMDDKWLRVYERTALFGETLEIIDHSPEIDTDLKIICFPTFKGHCGCILFKQAEIQTMRAEKPGGKSETGC